MEQQKASSTGAYKRFAKRSILALLGLAGACNFGRGLGEMLGGYGVTKSYPELFLFMLPYLLLFIVCCTVAVLAVLGKLRLSLLLFLLMFIGAAGLFVYDIRHPFTRAQHVYWCDPVQVEMYGHRTPHNGTVPGGLINLHPEWQHGPPEGTGRGN
jgi:hypothetical protein